ncbi:hypothetical protein [Streptomyces sp. NPDC001502]|uniref:hypothetical protein n=1 Tax=Streptomyces sp. NPDC001502 TaxID=3364578 RepID=UPI0036B6E4AA
MMTVRRVAGFGVAVAAVLTMALGVAGVGPAQSASHQVQSLADDAGWQSPNPRTVAASGQQTFRYDAGWQ